MSSKNYIMKRSFLPVGQGAFYMEEFVDGFTVVYDCGSYGNISLINSSIDRSELKNNIDLLVISHFHEDHINGLEHLFKKFTIKRMLLPYMELSEKINSFLDADLNGDTVFDKEFYLDTLNTYQSKFKINTEITFVKPEKKKTSQEIEIQNLGQEINSGDKLIYGLKDKIWSYIPFNFQNTRRSNLFKKLMKDLPIDTIADFKSYYTQNKKEIIDIYNKVPGDRNTNSLVLYSGPYSNIKTTIYSKRINFTMTQNKSACLYLGDYNTKGILKMRQLKNKYSTLFNKISTIQIPHHGSQHNYNKELNFQDNLISVISAGEYNQFKHPHSNTLQKITSQNGIIIIITENQATQLTQKIYVKKTKYD